MQPPRHGMTAVSRCGKTVQEGAHCAASCTTLGAATHPGRSRPALCRAGGGGQRRHHPFAVRSARGDPAPQMKRSRGLAHVAQLASQGCATGCTNRAVPVTLGGMARRPGLPRWASRRTRRRVCSGPLVEGVAHQAWHQKARIHLQTLQHPKATISPETCRYPRRRGWRQRDRPRAAILA